MDEIPAARQMHDAALDPATAAPEKNGGTWPAAAVLEETGGARPATAAPEETEGEWPATAVLEENGGAWPGVKASIGQLSHLVIIPSFNSGRLLARTVAAARAQWAPVWVVIDGSTDNSAAAVEAMARTDPSVRVLHLPINRGKGEAVRHGLIAAQASGFTHALVMDADGQHPADQIPLFMATSIAAPDAVVMGRPVFGPDAPWERVMARRVCNWCANVETQKRVGDTLFGFRVYPVAALLSVMQASRGMRRFDFDPEAVVRLSWQGAPLIHLPAKVRYLSSVEGGTSHFNYVRDNLLLMRMHLRLSLGALGRIPRMVRKNWGPASGVDEANPDRAARRDG